MDDRLPEVRRVLDDEALLDVVVQPIVDLAGASVAGWEVLSRPHPSLGLGPRALFDAATRQGAAGELQAVALRKALALRASAPPDTFLSINVDPPCLTHGAVLDVLTGAGDLRGVFVEITEQDWPDGHDEEALAVVRGLQEQGALIALDDVGAGYAGLTQLLRIRPQLVKLDKRLVDGLGTEPAAAAVVRALGEMAASLDAWLLVEGVETVEQLGTALREGVPLAQGFLLGRPSRPFPRVDLQHLRDVATRVALDDSVVSLLRPPEAFAVVHDDAGRPVRLGHPLPDGTLWYHPVLTMAPSTPVQQALDRALTRAAPDRFTPVLVTSREGALLGGVLVEDLVVAAGRTSAGAVPRQPVPVVEAAPPAVLPAVEGPAAPGAALPG